MDPELLQIGGVIGGIIAVVFILREIANFVRPLIERRIGGGKEPETEAIRRCVPEDVNLRQMASQLAMLYEWHDRKDEDGAPVWYVRSSLTRAIEQMAESQAQSIQILALLSQDVEYTRNALARIEKRLGTGGLKT